MNNDELLRSYRNCKIVFGGSAQAVLAELAWKRRWKTIVVFTGRTSADRSGAFTAVASAFPPIASVRRFREIGSEPDINTVTEMTEFLRANNPDAVIAIGGGSIMDAAKAAYAAMQGDCDVSEFFGSGKVSAYFDGMPNRIIAIPTTSGTGSEVTPYANIVDPQRGVKMLIADEAIIPEYAFVVPNYADTMSEQITRATGCDALAHLIEGFLNVDADANDALANQRALAGIRMIAEHFPALLNRTGNLPEHRKAMAEAATLGGMVIRYKSTGLPHLCSFSWFGIIEHGIAVSLLLPASWRYYIGREEVAERTMELSSIFPGTTPEEVIASFRRFLDDCGVPGSLQDIEGITPELLDATAQSGAENPMKLALAPRPVALEESEEVLAKILQDAWEG